MADGFAEWIAGAMGEELSQSIVRAVLDDMSKEWELNADEADVNSSDFESCLHSYETCLIYTSDAADE